MTTLYLVPTSSHRHPASNFTVGPQHRGQQHPFLAQVGQQYVPNHQRQGLYFGNDGLSDDEDDYEQLNAKAAYFQRQAQAALARRQSIQRQRALEAEQERQRARQREVERLRQERAALIEQEIQRRRRAAIAQARAQAQAQAQAQAARARAVQAHAQREAILRHVQQQRERAQYEQRRQQFLQQERLGTVLEDILSAAFSGLFDEQEKDEVKTHEKPAASTTPSQTESATKGKGKAKEIGSPVHDASEQHAPETRLDREKLAAKAIEEAQQALLGNVDINTFTQAFGDLFHQVFGFDSQTDTEPTKQDDGKKEVASEAVEPLATSSPDTLERTIPVEDAAAAPSDTPARAVPYDTEEPVAGSSATEAPSSVNVRPASPALSTSSKRSSTSSTHSRKIAHVRDADENGEEILLPEDELVILSDGSDTEDA